ncbi:MAG TPA: type II toxin-antitoxin system RelE/ParE family toxin [Solirubrobacterales bacterium]|nr:type II toxin-antitoxin system RelE/ParE family toxin [Solirubrobacterales bacterium]
MKWNVEFFSDDSGHQPAREWLQSLPASKRAAAIAAIEYVLAELGPDVCRTEYGKHLGKGLFEFRVRHSENVIRAKAGQEVVDDGSHEPVMLRIFCHAHGERIVLLLGGYDKGDAPAKRKQQREIEVARKRLRSFELRRARDRTGKQRRR